MAIGPTINSDDLDQYARRKEAENDIAELVRHLVCSSLTRTSSSIRFRSGQGIRLGGYDGIVQVSAGGFQVPPGNSVWELSTREDCDAKADEDYEARTKDSQGTDTQNTFYVAVTMRKWPQKEQWAKQRNKENKWRGVVALDAGDLATWLEAAPGVAAWFRRHSGIAPVGMIDAEGFLESWGNSTDPKLNPVVLTLGRNEQSDLLRSWLAGPPSRLILRGDTAEEAVAFVCAVISQLDDDVKQFLLAKTVIVQNEAALRELVDSSGADLVLIPYFPEYAGSLEPTKKGYQLVVPQDTGASSAGAPIGGNEVTLPAQSKETISTYLVANGFQEDRAQHLAEKCGGRLTILRRLLGYNQPPTWANSKTARDLIPFLLLGRWEPGKTGDVEIVEKYFEIKPVTFEATLLTLKNTGDAPVQQEGYTWKWRSRSESWNLLSAYISDGDLDTFGELSKDVLGEIDPAVTLPPEEQWSANVKGKVPKYSGVLRAGIAETLALLANANGSMDQCRRFDPVVVTRNVIHAVLQTDWKSWASLKEVLPDLAEGAPDTFLSRLEESIKVGASGVAHLFSQHRDAFFGGIPQAGVLWALERLAWDPALLGRVSLILGQLQAFDNSANNIGNRPINSLRETLCAWLPQTFASVQERMKVMRTLSKRLPSFTWGLAKSLIPRGSEAVTHRHLPSWRSDFAGRVRPRATMGEVFTFVNELSGLLIEMAQADPKLLPELVDMIERLPEATQKNLLMAMKAAVPSIDSETKKRFRDEMQEFLHRTRAYPDANWTSKNKEVIALADEVLVSLSPTNIIERYVWLFAGWPKFPEGEPRDYHERQKLVTERRTAALDEILRGGADLDSLLKLVELSEQVYPIGDLLASSKAKEKEEIEQAILRWNPNITKKSGEFLGAWVFRRNALMGRAWVGAYIESLKAKQNLEAIVVVLTALPCDAETWKMAEAQGVEVFKRYWMQTPVFFIEGQWEEIKIVLQYLLDVNRILDVARIFSDFVCENGERKRPSSSEIINFLGVITDAIVKLHEPIGDLTMLTHYLGEVFKKLDGAADVRKDELAIIEWRLFPILEHSHVSTGNLFWLIENRPEFFAELVSLIYKPEQESSAQNEDEILRQQESPELARLRATRAYSLLDHSWKAIPGRREDNSFDGPALINWVNSAREKLRAMHRSTIGEMEIGKVLARSPAGADTHWPAEAVRQLIEEAPDESLGRGFHVAVLNNRGVTVRNPFDGGKLERALVAQYDGWANILSIDSPQTAALLRALADSYRFDARREDLQAERFIPSAPGNMTERILAELQAHNFGMSPVAHKALEAMPRDSQEKLLAILRGWFRKNHDEIIQSSDLVKNQPGAQEYSFQVTNEYCLFFALVEPKGIRLLDVVKNRTEADKNENGQDK
jgi:hypothetical protein